MTFNREDIAIPPSTVLSFLFNNSFPPLTTLFLSLTNSIPLPRTLSLDHPLLSATLFFYNPLPLSDELYPSL